MNKKVKNVIRVGVIAGLMTAIWLRGTIEKYLKDLKKHKDKQETIEPDEAASEEKEEEEEKVVDQEPEKPATPQLFIQELEKEPFSVVYERDYSEYDILYVEYLSKYDIFIGSYDRDFVIHTEDEIISFFGSNVYDAMEYEAFYVINPEQKIIYQVSKVD